MSDKEPPDAPGMSQRIPDTELVAGRLQFEKGASQHAPEGVEGGSALYYSLVD